MTTAATQDLAVLVEEEQRRLTAEARTNVGSWEYRVLHRHAEADAAVTDAWLSILRRRHPGVSWDVTA